jgi:hypothetical protein
VWPDRRDVARVPGSKLLLARCGWEKPPPERRLPDFCYSQVKGISREMLKSLRSAVFNLSCIEESLREL